MFSFRHKILDHFRREASRKKKLDELFQEGKKVRSVHTGEVYTVVVLMLDSALLQGPQGQPLVVEWLTPWFTLNSKIVDDWDPVAD